MAYKTIHDLTAVAAAAAADEIELWRAANADTRKITRADFLGGLDSEVEDARNRLPHGAVPITDLGDTVEYLSLGRYNVLAYGALGDGAADDTTAIAAALTAAGTAGGGVVIFPPGDYLVSTLTVPDNTAIEGQGLNTLIEVTNTSGNGLILGDNARLRNLKILYEAQSTVGHALVYVDGDNVTIDGVTVEATFAATAVTQNLVSAIRVTTDGANFTVNNCHLIGPSISAPFYDGVGQAGWGIIIHGDDCSGKISNVTSEGWNDGIKVTSENGDVVIVNCHLKHNNRDGFDGYYSGGGHIAISNCIFSDNQDLVADFKTIGSDPDDGLDYALNFVGNIAYDHTNSGGSSSGGLIASANRRLLIANNQFINQRYGISVNQGSGGPQGSGGVISGNRIENVVLYGIQAADVSDGATTLTITNNVIVNAGTAQTDPTTCTGIRLESCSNGVVMGNSITWRTGTIADWSKVSAISLASTVTNCMIAHNYGNRGGAGSMISASGAWTANFIWNNIGTGTQTEGAIRYHQAGHYLQVHNGTTFQTVPFWETANAFSGANTFSALQTFSAGVRSGSIGINNGQLGTITGVPTRGMLLIFADANVQNAAIINYRAPSTSFCNKMTGGTNIAVTTGILTAGGGADLVITVSVHTDNNIYISNRVGANHTFYYLLIG